jgi:hypothetical protein
MHGHASEAESLGHMAMLEPSRTRGGSEAAGHVVTPKPFPAEQRAWCHRAHGDGRALPHQEASLERWNTWRH